MLCEKSVQFSVKITTSSFRVDRFQEQPNDFFTSATIATVARKLGCTVARFMRLIIRLFCFIREKSVPFSLAITAFSLSVYRFQEQPNDFFTSATIATVARKLGCTVARFMRLIIRLFCFICEKSMPFSLAITAFSLRVDRFQEQPNDFFTSATSETVERKLGCTVSLVTRLIIRLFCFICEKSMPFSLAITAFSLRVDRFQEQPNDFFTSATSETVERKLGCTVSLVTRLIIRLFFFICEKSVPFILAITGFSLRVDRFQEQPNDFFTSATSETVERKLGCTVSLVTRLIIRLFCFICEKSMPFSLAITGFSLRVDRFQEQPNDFFTSATSETVERKLGCTVSLVTRLIIRLFFFICEKSVPFSLAITAFSLRVDRFQEQLNDFFTGATSETVERKLGSTVSLVTRLIILF